jgi:putative transposase
LIFLAPYGDIIYDLYEGAGNMFVDRNQLAEGTAWITPEGILFRGSFYSCRKALREGWFARAEERDPTAVQVLYEGTAAFHPAIYIDSEEFMEDCLCLLLPNRGLHENALVYQERIRKLQEERKQIRNK